MDIKPRLLYGQKAETPEGIGIICAYSITNGSVDIQVIYEKSRPKYKWFKIDEIRLLNAKET